MKNRVVLLINSLDGGGAERVVSTLLNNLVQSYDCYLILIEKNDLAFELDSRVKILCLNEKLYKNGLFKFIRLPIIAYKLALVIKEYNFKRVTSFLYRANYINIISNFFAKHYTVISERIAPSSMYQGLSINSIVSRFLIHVLYRHSDLIISVSRGIELDLKNNFNIHVKQTVIYNPYDINKIKKLSSESIPYEIDKEFSIISVGTLTKRKNCEQLILAFSNIQYKNYKLYILGKGEEEIYLKKLTHDLRVSDRVVFLGFDNNPYKFMSKCKFFVLNSKSEGFPNVLVEAMICGCGVISTDCLSGPREIMSFSSNINFKIGESIDIVECGILVPVDNPKKLTKAIEILIGDKKLLSNHLEMTTLKIKEFDSRVIIDKYKEILCAE